MNLRLDWCSHEAARFAVEHWHYSRSMPVGKMVKIGVWEHGRFVGAIVFAQGNNQFQGKALGLTMHQICELVRVALTTHDAPVSRIVAVALRMLKGLNPGLRAVLSYADPEQGHVGGIYQAMGWIYVGVGGSHEAFYHQGKRVHSRNVSKTGRKEHFGVVSPSLKAADLTRVSLRQKYKYLYPLDAEIRAQIAPLAKPYPKRVRSAENGTEVPTSGGGVIPTRTLQV